MPFFTASVFHGGVALPPRKLGAEAPSRHLPVPEQAFVLLTKNNKEIAHPLVKEGDFVDFEQPVARGLGTTPDSHAPGAGRVAGVRAVPSPYQGGVLETAIVIHLSKENKKYKQTDEKQSAQEALRKMGVAGLGGAAFPTWQKLTAAGRPHTLLINGAECEPMLSCDQCLMRERAADILRAVAHMQGICGATRVVMALEADKRDAVAAMEGACAAYPQIQLIALPPRYPQGGEKQLIQAVLGVEVPSGSHAAAQGILVLNVATVLAAWEALTQHKPLTHRLVTVTGMGVRAPGNVWVPIGTPVADVLAFCGYDPTATVRINLGGPMMGRTVTDLATPITKGTSAVLALTKDEVAMAEPQPCIRCGGCAEVCPARLRPEALLFDIKASRLQRARDGGVMDCIACGACDYVCPSAIPLVAHYLYAKDVIRTEDEEQARADYIGALVRKREERLAKRKAERLAKTGKADSAKPRTVETAVMEKINVAREKARLKNGK
jgi:electron transport complex protein RnfC